MTTKIEKLEKEIKRIEKFYSYGTKPTAVKKAIAERKHKIKIIKDINNNINVLRPF